jgi:Uncharacterized conserved protein
MTDEDTHSDAASDVTDCTDCGLSSDTDTDTNTNDATLFDVTVRDGVCRLSHPNTRWLSTGYDGGISRCDTAYLLSVPNGWTETAVSAYIAERCATAGFEYVSTAIDDRSLTDTQTEPPHNNPHASNTDTTWMSTETKAKAETHTPALLTGVDLQHARRARLDPVEAIVTAGISNPATLPMPEMIDNDRSTEDITAKTDTSTSGGLDDSQNNKAARDNFGTVNIILGTTHSLTPGALSNLVAVVSEAKTATLMTQTGFTGTTSDAVLIASDTTGSVKQFSGSATAVGNAARVCVRDALCAALTSRYGTDSPPKSVQTASHGIMTNDRASVSPIQLSDETETTTTESS